MSTPNSSFILLRRRRSIRLWAVLRAILRPAVVPFFVLRGAVVGAVLEREAVVVAVVAASAFLADEVGILDRGFIWMILRERVGGGGSVDVAVE